MQNRMQTRPDSIVDYDILGLQARRQHAIAQQHNKEDDMKSGLYLELADSDWYLDLKDGPDDWDQLLARLREAGLEMESEKFRELMARQIALLGPAGSIADLVRNMLRDGVVAARATTTDQQIVTFIRDKQAGEERTAQELASRRRRPSYKM